MPASPFQDKKAFKEVQETPQEAITLSISQLPSVLKKNKSQIVLNKRLTISETFYLLSKASESEEEEYHKKKKRSQSKSPSERSSSGESGECFSRLSESFDRHVEEMQPCSYVLLQNRAKL